MKKYLNLAFGFWPMSFCFYNPLENFELFCWIQSLLWSNMHEIDFILGESTEDFVTLIVRKVMGNGIYVKITPLLTFLVINLYIWIFKLGDFNPTLFEFFEVIWKACINKNNRSRPWMNGKVVGGLGPMLDSLGLGNAMAYLAKWLLVCKVTWRYICTSKIHTRPWSESNEWENCWVNLMWAFSHIVRNL